MSTTLVRPRTDESPPHPLQHVGGLLLRYGLVSILLWVGLLKFTAYEALAIKPFVEHSPLLSWLYDLFSVRTLSAMLGTFEIALALMIAVKPFSWMISAVGSFGAVALFLVTLTFLLSSPDAFQSGYGVPFLSPFPGQFVAKDVGLLAIAVWTAGEALSARRS